MFGVDFIFNDRWDPFLLEFNLSPELGKGRLWAPLGAFAGYLGGIGKDWGGGGAMYSSTSMRVWRVFTKGLDLIVRIEVASSLL